MQLFSHLCIFMMLRPNGMFPYELAHRHVNDLRSWVSAGDDRLPEKTGDLYPFRLETDLQQVGRNLPAVNVIDHIS